MAANPSLPLLSGAPLDAPLAWRDGVPITRRTYIADVARLAARLPPAGPVLAMTADRYRFALALGAAALRGQYNLQPPNHTPDTLRRLLELFPGACALVDGDAAEGNATAGDFPALPFASFAESSLPAAPLEMPYLPAEAIVAQVLTSGSTGMPSPHPKRWGRLAQCIAAAVQHIVPLLGRDDLTGCNFVGTVPAHHMYGFESTVLVAFFSGAAFACERPFFPAEIVRSLERLPRPRVLVTTPLHLKTLLESGLPLPPIDLTLSATDVLPLALARRAEDALGAPLLEIYGCTEAGQIASRRTIHGEPWRCFDGLTVSGEGARYQVQGGHVEEPTPLADVLEIVSPSSFNLLGRSNDLINIAGKRSSLSHLNHQLHSIGGVVDGAFWMPSEADLGPGSATVARLVAFVVLDRLTPADLIGELRQRVDAAFLPRRVVQVASLPRDPTGKLPAGRLAEFARATLRAGE
jgi:acyl-coenzyme A synthetase/AMP-(fatty) acid ligase